MSAPVKEVRERSAVRLAPAVAEVPRGLAELTGLEAGLGDPTKVTAPSLNVALDETSWDNLLRDPEQRMQRLTLAAQLRTIAAVEALRRSEGIPAEDAARRHAERARQTCEQAYVDIADANRTREEAVRAAALYFRNQMGAEQILHGMTWVVSANAKELASTAGRAWLSDTLGGQVNWPDPTDSFGYVVVPGWVGGRAELHELSETVHVHRAVLISDSPRFANRAQLQEAAKPGNLMSTLAGDTVKHRHTVLIGGHGRARVAFAGRYVEEKAHTFVPLSAPWFGLYLKNIALGEPWNPAVGFRNPIAGVDSVECPLRLEKGEKGYTLFSAHRVNPAMPLRAGSPDIVIWGCDTLSRADQGVQIGVAVVEQITARHAEWIVNRDGLLTDLEGGVEAVRHELKDFITRNSGAGRMFRTGSRAQVVADYAERGYQVTFDLRFREVAEFARVAIKRAADGEPIEVEATSDRRTRRP